MHLVARNAIATTSVLQTQGYEVVFSRMLELIKQTFDEAYYEMGSSQTINSAIAKDGKVYSAFRGNKDLTEGNDVSLDSINWMASMTKPIVSAAIMKMVVRQDLPRR